MRRSAASACSAMYCTDSSMVSSSPVPGRAETEPFELPGRVTPSASNRFSVPGFPANIDWYWYSSPDVPLPFHPVVPTTGRAS